MTLSVPAATAGGEDSYSVPVQRLASGWSALSPQPAPGASEQSPQEPEIHREQACGSHVQVGAVCVLCCVSFMCVLLMCVCLSACECVCWCVSVCVVGVMWVLVSVCVCVPGPYTPSTPIYSEHYMHTIMDCMQLMDGWCVYVCV